MSGTAPDLALLRRYRCLTPSDPCYPPMTTFGPMGPDDHRRAVERANAVAADAPLALYVHVPFCPDACFHCNCHRVITRDEGLIVHYLHALLREIELQGLLFGRRRPIEHLHLGGGSPGYLSDEQLRTVLDQIERSFGWTAAPRREFSIEVDPRTTDAPRLARLVAMGFNRVTLGLQDFEPDVQRSINRHQPPEWTEALVRTSRALGLRSINVDLMQGLPEQTLDGFSDTLDRVISAQPDRVTVVGYAHRPTAFKVQRHIHVDRLPDPELRLHLLHTAVRKLLAVGYVHVGMYLFARREDELVRALERGSLHRTGPGYFPRAGLNLVGVGMSGVSRLGGAYTQNASGLAQYEDAIGAGELATRRGVWLGAEDHLRAAVIERILCGREVRYGVLSARFSLDVHRHFRAALAKLAQAERDGLVQRLPDRLVITPLGRYFLDAIASPFDAYRSRATEAGGDEGRLARKR